MQIARLEKIAEIVRERLGPLDAELKALISHKTIQIEGELAEKMGVNAQKGKIEGLETEYAKANEVRERALFKFRKIQSRESAREGKVLDREKQKLQRVLGTPGYGRSYGGGYADASPFGRAVAAKVARLNGRVAQIREFIHGQREAVWLIGAPEGAVKLLAEMDKTLPKLARMLKAKN